MTLVSQRRIQPLEPGWVHYLDQRMPGETPHPADDFFTDDDHSSWTLVQVTGTTTITEKYGLLSLRDAGTSAQDLNSMVKSMGGLSAPVTIETAFAWMGGTNPGAGSVALGMTDGTTSASNSAVINVYAVTLSTSFSGGTLSTFDQGVSTNFYNRPDLVQSGRLYLRFCWKAANTFRIAFSPDGVSWLDLSGSNISRTFSPTHFALGVSAYGSTAQTMVGFDYFRVAEADLITP